MAKNYKKNNKKSVPAEKEFSAYCEEQFLITYKALRKLSHSRVPASIQQDLTPEFRKRRSLAIQRTLKETEAHILPVIQEYPENDLLWKDAWVYINALPITSYDMMDSVMNLSLAASMWMLDQYKACGRLEDAIELLPSSDNIDVKLSDGMPELWEVSYSTDLLTMMRQVIIQRNNDCQPPQQENSICVRAFMDAATVSGQQHQDVPSRRLFQSLVALLPEEAVRQAKERFTDLYWDWTKRLFRTRLTLNQRELELDRKIDRLSLQIKAAEDTLAAKRNLLQQKKPLLMAASHDPLGLFQSRPDDKLASFQRLDTLYKEYDRRIAQQEQLTSEVGHILLRLCSRVSKGPAGMQAHWMPEELLPLWKDFHMDDPYELCFAFLMLLDEGSDLPWMYYPTVGLLSVAGERLPWNYMDYDEEEETTEELPPSHPLLKTDWLSLTHIEETEDDNEENDDAPYVRNLAQVFYRLTGMVLPRRFDRFQGTIEELNRLGVTDEREQELLLTAMSLLEETRHRSDLPVLSADLEEEAPSTEDNSLEEDMDALRERLSHLKKENERLKSTAYEATRALRDARKQSEEREKAHEQERQELADLRELVFTLQEGSEEKEDNGTETITFPCETTHRIVSFGGHDSWAREIRKKLPNVRFIDRDQLPNSETIRRADFIFIQSNSLSHAYFYRIIEEARRYNVPVRYFSYASAVKCAEQLVLADRAF